MRTLLTALPVGVEAATPDEDPEVPDALDVAAASLETPAVTVTGT